MLPFIGFNGKSDIYVKRHSVGTPIVNNNNVGY